MAMQVIKNGGFVAEEISKINANFTEVESSYAKKTEIPSVPTKTSQLTNDSGFITSAAVPTKTSDLTNDSNFVNQTQLTTAVNGITVPSKTSDLTNDSGFTTTTAMNTAITNAVNAIDIPTKTSELTNDSNFVSTTQLNNAVTGAAPTKVTFTAANWSNGTFTTPANSKNPSVVMRKNGSNYGVALVDVQVIGTNVVITSDEAFEGYIMLV